MTSFSRKFASYKLLLIALALLSSCQSQMRVLESAGAIRVEPSQQPGSDYIVHIKNTVDFGFTPDDKSNREKWALDLLKSQCGAPKIVDEKSVVTGKFATGREAKTYFIYVDC